MIADLVPNFSLNYFREGTVLAKAGVNIRHLVLNLQEVCMQNCKQQTQTRKKKITKQTHFALSRPNDGDGGEDVALPRNSHPRARDKRPPADAPAPNNIETAKRSVSGAPRRQRAPKLERYMA